MDGGGRIDRDSDLGDDSPMSHIDEHSDREDDMRDCDSSDEGVNVHPHTSIAPGMDFGRSPDHHNDGHMSIFGTNQGSHFGQNHPLGVLGNLTALNMGVSGLQGLSGLQNLHHGDVLEKLKMQVRDMKVGLMEQQDFTMHPFGGSLQTPANTSFTVPSISNSQPQNLSQSQSNSTNGFPFTTPTVPCTKDGNPGSNSSTSSETSNSSQQNNGWSFEEQYKQVRQLYEINDDPKRKEFLDDLFSFMQKRGTPINRLPIMAKSVLDLYELYNLVIARGGLVDVINKKLWQEIIKGLHLPSSITSAAFTLRTQYMKYLYPYECEKKNLSTPAELQAAIDGNRREGRRSSYGQFDTQMQGQLQMSQVSHQRSPVPSSMQQMSPLSLVTHGNTPSAHHRLMGGQMTSLVPHEIEQRMMEYIKLIHNSKETRRNNEMFSGSQSPEISTREALNALEMSRVALWSMYNNNTSPPTSINTSPPGNEPQREALNLSESPPHPPIKREREHPTDFSDRDFVQPPAKRGLTIIPQQQQQQPHPLNSSLDERDDRSNTPTNQHDNLITERNNIQNNNNNNNNITNSHHQNGTDNNNSTSVINGMQFKITSRGNASTGDQKLVVAMEFNGVLYEGVLFANSSTTQTNSTTPTPTTIPTSSTPSSTLNNTSSSSSSSLSSTNNTNNIVNNSIDERTNRISHPLVSS